MKRIAQVFLLFALAFTSCSKEEAGKVVIRFLDGPDRGGGWKEIIALFEEAHPDIDVELVEGPAATDTREDMYATSFLSGESTYDMVYLDVIWTSKFAAVGWLIPLDDRFTQEQQEQFLPGGLAASRYRGKIYRVPMCTGAGMLYYRKDILQEPPKTWAEFINLAKKHQKPDELWGFVFQGRQYEGLVCNFLEWVWGAGGDLMDDQGNVLIDSPEAVWALQTVCDIIQKHKICPPGVTTYQEEETRHIFQEGKALFMRNWPYAWTLIHAEGSPVSGKVGIAPMVHKKGSSSAATLGGWGFGISRFSRHPEEAWKFIMFATSAESQKAFHFKNGSVPTRHALFKDPDILNESPHYSDLYQILLAARPRPMHPKYAQIADQLEFHVSAALVGREGPQQALKAAADEIRNILKSGKR